MFEISNNSNISLDPDWGNSLTHIHSAYRVEVMSPYLDSESMWFFFLLLPDFNVYEGIDDEETLAFTICLSFLDEKDHVNVFKVNDDKDFKRLDKAVPILTFDPSDPMKYIWLKPPKAYSC